MAWSGLDITRGDIDAVEGETFSGINVTSGGSALNISEFDDEVKSQAKDELESDVLDITYDLINDETYASETALLDALEAADSRNILADLLVYKFLELFFAQDAQSTESIAWEKAGNYHQKYENKLRQNLQRLASQLSDPQRIDNYKFGHTYGY